MTAGHYLPSSLSLLLLFISLTFSSGSFSLGLGSIESESLLGQPLRARIPVLDELREYRADDLIVRKLDNKQAEQLGFEVVTSSYGITLMLEDFPDGLVLLAKSSKPVTEPFISFFVELQWPQGSLIREYTLLLDPPPVPSAVQPVAGSGPAGSDVKKAAPDSASVSTKITRNATTRATTTSTISDSAGSYRVKTGDTLSAIAGRWVQGQQRQESVQATMQWLFANNPQAFVGNDINRLMAGARLRLPEPGQASMAMISAAAEPAQRDRGGAETLDAAEEATEEPDAGEQSRAWMSNLPARPEQDGESSQNMSMTSVRDGSGMVRLSQEVESADDVPSFADIESESTETVQSYLDATRETIDVVRRENAQLQRQIEAIENSDYLNNLKELVELQRRQLAQLKSELKEKTGLEDDVERYAATVADRAMNNVDGFKDSGAASGLTNKNDSDSLWQIEEEVDLQQESVFNRDTAKWVAALGLFLLAIVLFLMIVRRLWLQQQYRFTARRLPVAEAPLVVGASSQAAAGFGNKPAAEESSFDDYLQEDFQLHEDDLKQLGSFDLDDLDELIAVDVKGSSVEDSLTVSEFEDVTPRTKTEKASEPAIDDDWDDLFDAIVNKQIADGKEPEGFDLQLDIEDVLEQSNEQKDGPKDGQKDKPGKSK